MPNPILSDYFWDDGSESQRKMTVWGLLTICRSFTTPVKARF